MPRIPSFPNNSCGAPHVPISASEDIKLQIMAARLREQLQNEFAEKADLKTINNESLLISTDGSNNININGIVDIKKTATEGLIDTYTITFTDDSVATFTVRNGQDGISPTITTTTIEGGTRVTISDVNGSRSFDILNGIDGNSADIPTKVSELENDVGYITAADIPEIDLSDYYNKTETENLINAAVESIEHPTVDLSGYATKEWVNEQGYIKSLEGYATEAYVDEQISAIDLSGYAKVEDIPTDYLTESDLAGYSKFSGSYNDLTDKPEIPSIEGLASEEFVKSEIAAIDIPEADLTNYYTKAETAETIAAAVTEKADKIPFTTDKFVNNPVGLFKVGDNLNGLTIGEILAKLLELRDTNEPMGIIATIIANKMPMQQVNELGELVEIPFVEILDLTANANVDATVSGFYQIKDKTGTVIESGYQHDSAINDSMYYVIALPKELVFGENLSVQTWDTMANEWTEVPLEMSSDPVFIAEAFAEGGIPIPAVDTSIYTLWIDATLNTCAGTSYRFIINEKGVN